MAGSSPTGCCSCVGPVDFLLLGATTGWLALHHVKGAYFGAALYAVCWIALGVEPARERGRLRRRLLALHAGLAAILLAWLGAALAFGLAGDFFAVYASFFDLAVEQPRVWVWAALGPVMLRDAAWWGVALVGVVWGVRRLSTRRDAWRLGENAPTLFALLLAVPPLLFLLVHPRPWPYMLALPAPLLALLAASALVEWLGRPPAARQLAALVLVTAWLVGCHWAGGVWPGTHFAVAMHAPNIHQVESLRHLQAIAAPTERIVDPSGLAWFQPPCTSEWYVDALFQTRVARGQWMSGLARASAGECLWLLRSYRLEMLPDGWKVRAAADYRPIGGGLLLAAGDARHTALARLERPAHEELRSFWW